MLTVTFFNNICSDFEQKKFDARWVVGIIYKTFDQTKKNLKFFMRIE